MEIFGYVASIGIGIILGLLGGGGSILSIPILVYLFQVDAVMASAYSLFIVGFTSLVGAIPKYQDHLVDLKTSFLFGIPSILSIFITRKWIVPAIPEVIFQIDGFTFSKRLLILGLFAFLMIVSSWSMIRGRKDLSSDDHERRIGLLLCEGVLIGFLTGLIGAGGGFLIIPALVWLTGLPFKTAVGTSLLIIAINSLLGFVGDLLNSTMNWNLLLSITGLAVLGILIGNKFQKRVSGSRLKVLFGWLILLMGLWILTIELVSSISS